MFVSSFFQEIVKVNSRNVIQILKHPTHKPKQFHMKKKRKKFLAVHDKNGFSENKKKNQKK